MPRECIPQHELLRLYAKPQERAAHNRCRRFGKAVWTLLGPAGAPRINVEEEIVGFQTDFLASPEQQSLRSHGDSAKATATVSERFPNYCKSCGLKSFAKIGA